MITSTIATILSVSHFFIYYTFHLCPQHWHTASLWVLVLVFVRVLVIAGIISTSPQVQTARSIQSAQPRQPLCLVLVCVSVTACIVTLYEPHLEHFIVSSPLNNIIYHIILFVNSYLQKNIGKAKNFPDNNYLKYI